MHLDIFVISFIYKIYKYTCYQRQKFNPVSYIKRFIDNILYNIKLVYIYIGFYSARINKMELKKKK